MAQKGTKWHRRAQNSHYGTKLQGIAQNDTKLHKIAQNCTKLHKIAQNCTKCLTVAQIDTQLHKMENRTIN
jgi:hypothetical protein